MIKVKMRMGEKTLGRFCNRKSDFQRDDKTITAAKMYSSKNQRFFKIRWEVHV